jgi:hypothetical protein
MVVVFVCGVLMGVFFSHINSLVSIIRLVFSILPAESNSTNAKLLLEKSERPRNLQQIKGATRPTGSATTAAISASMLS